MSSPRVESSSAGLRRTRALRWLLPAALLALAPKCVLCVLAYLGAGAALGLGGPEWCGVSETGSTGAWITTLAWLGAAGVVGSIGFFANCRRKKSRDA